MFNFKVIRLGNAAMVWSDRSMVDAAAPVLDKAIGRLLDSGVSSLVIDLVRVPSIDGPVIAVLAAAARRTGRRGRRLELRLSGGRSAAVRDAAQLRSAIEWAYPTAA